MSSYCNPNKKFIFNDEQIFLKKVNMPIDKRMYLSASSTVEASLVIPLFMYAVMTVIYLLQVVGLQIKVQQALYNESRKLAKYIYAYEMINGKHRENDENYNKKIIDIGGNNGKDQGFYTALENGIGVATVHSLFMNELGSNYINNSNVVGGMVGFHMLDSNIISKNNMIEIVVTYSVRNPFDLFGIGVMTFTQNAVTCAWMGDTYNSEVQSSKNKTEEVIVYITPSGRVYHTNRNCSYLVLSIHKIPKSNLEDERNESGGKYDACEKCGKNNISEDVFVTEYGDRFHTTTNCSSIMRTVMAVPLKTVENRNLCSKCKGD